MTFDFFVLIKNSLKTPTNNQKDNVPQIIAKIVEPFILYKAKAAIRELTVSIVMIFTKFLGLPLPQFRKGAIAINKIIGVIIGANVAL